MKLSTLAALLFFLIIINLAVIDTKMFQPKKEVQAPAVEVTDKCPGTCVDLINHSLNAIPSPGAVITQTTITKAIETPKTKTRLIQYMPVPGDGATLENKWIDLPGTEFYLATQDYPGLKEAYFEANMKLLNGNGMAYSRLFDMTAGIEVWGSETKTASQKFNSISSAKLTLRNGNHLYRVQAKSLTADTAIFNGGRIKIITEN